MCADATGDVLELMSGTGRVSLPLLRAAVPLTCVDYSAEMLRVLSQRLKAENLIADLHEHAAQPGRSNPVLGRHAP